MVTYTYLANLNQTNELEKCLYGVVLLNPHITWKLELKNCMTINKLETLYDSKF